jgi:hypothetical protein
VKLPLLDAALYTAYPLAPVTLPHLTFILLYEDDDAFSEVGADSVTAAAFTVWGTTIKLIINNSDVIAEIIIIFLILFKIQPPYYVR